MLDDNPHMLAAIDVMDVLDKAFVIAADQHACSFCKGTLVYHKFKECLLVATFMREGMAYDNGNMDPVWNLDMQDKPSTSLPPRLPGLFGKSVVNKLTVNKNIQLPRAGSRSRVPHVDLATVSPTCTNCAQCNRASCGTSTPEETFAPGQSCW